MAPRRRAGGDRTQTALMKLGKAEVIARVCVFMRSVVVQNALGPALLGIAAPMIIIVDFLDRVFALHSGMVVVQDKQGGSGHFRRTLQTIMAARGLILGLTIIILAIPLAVLNELDDSPWYVAGFMAVGLVPMIRGFGHIDVQRRYRNKEFTPVAQVQIWNEVGSLVIASLLCMVMVSFWVPVLVRIGASVVMVAITFRLARRRFRFGWNRDDAIRIVWFVAPLMVAGLIVFLSTTGPRQLVSSAGYLFDQVQYTKEDLGILTNAIMFAIAPAAIGGRLIQGPWSPKLARLRDDPERFQASYAVMQQFAYCVSGASLLLIGPGTVWIETFFPAYGAASGAIVSVLAFRTALRIGASGTKCAMLSLGHSKYIMLINLGGLVAPIGAAWVIMRGGTLIEIAYWIVIGEIASFIIANLLVKHSMKQLRIVDIWIIPIMIMIGSSVILYIDLWVIEGLNNYLAIMITAMFSLGVLAAGLLVFPQIRPSRRKDR